MNYRSHDVKQALLWNQERRTKTVRENYTEWLNIWRNISSMRRAVFHQQMKHRAKWGERGILRESRDGFKRKIKIKGLLQVHCSGSSHVHQMNVALQLVNRWRVALARFWHVCLEQNDSDAVMFFWRCWWQSSSFTLKCSRNKGKTKEIFKCIAYCPFYCPDAKSKTRFSSGKFGNVCMLHNCFIFFDCNSCLTFKLSTACSTTLNRLY